MAATAERFNPYMTDPIKAPDPKCPDCLGTGLDRDFAHNCVCVLDPAVFERSLRSYGREDLGQDGTPRQHGDGGPGYGQGQPRKADGPSEKQIEFYARLLGEIHENARLVVEAAGGTWNGQDSANGIEQSMVKFRAMKPREASETIDAAMSAVAETKRQVRLTVPAAALPVRSNRYPGQCQTCRGFVEAEAGRIEKINGQWKTFHLAGQCVETPAPSSGSPAAPGAVHEVPAGHYAITSHGSNDLIFLRVDHGTGQYEGRIFGKFIVGGRPDERIPFRQLPGLLARIVEEGVIESSRRYGREIGRCCLCNRELTDQESRAAGIGPDCANK